MKKCIICQNELLDDAQFCSQCGSKIEKNQEVKQERKCKNCQAELLDNAQFCPNCGTKNEKAAELPRPTHCKNCQAELLDNAQFCQACGAKIEDMLQATAEKLKKISPTTYHSGNEEKNCYNYPNSTESAKKDCLQLGEKIAVWIAVTLIPLGIIVTAIIYYNIRKKYPKKASELNKHSFIAFGVGILLAILLNSCDAGINGW